MGALAAVIVTFSGALGLTLGTTDQQAAARFHTPSVVVPYGGSSALSYVGICKPGLSGAAVFFGLGMATEPYVEHSGGTLILLTFTRGAKTDKGVGIGSRLAAVERAYPAAAPDPADSRNLYLVAPRPVRGTLHTAIYFEFAKGRVDRLLWGPRQELVGADPALRLEKTYCP